MSARGRLIGVRVTTALILSWSSLRPDVRAQSSGSFTPIGDPNRGERIAVSCSRCHGERGISSEPWIPNLAGLSQAAIYKELDDYRSHRRRPEWYMASIAQSLSPEESADVAAYYERQRRAPAVPVSFGIAPPAAAACGTCHNTGKYGAPAIAGQQPEYLEIQLSLFAQEIRSNDRDSVMRKIASQLTPDQIRQISAFLGKASH